jgi:hypothetical protein
LIGAVVKLDKHSRYSIIMFGVGAVRWFAWYIWHSWFATCRTRCRRGGGTLGAVQVLHESTCVFCFLMWHGRYICVY